MRSGETRDMHYGTIARSRESGFTTSSHLLRGTWASGFLRFVSRQLRRISRIFTFANQLSTAALCVYVFLLCISSTAQATLTQFTVPLSGSQEGAGQGDPDGSGIANLTIDRTTNTISWNIATSNIA